MTLPNGPGGFGYIPNGSPQFPKQSLITPEWSGDKVVVYEVVRDFLKASEKAWGIAWGHAGYMVTRPVTLKAMLRVCADLAREDAEPADGRVRRWEKRLSPWTDLTKMFRAEGFYERFPAKGQVERVGRIQRELARAAGVEVRRRKGEEAISLLAGGRR